MSPYVTRWRE